MPFRRHRPPFWAAPSGPRQNGCRPPPRPSGIVPSGSRCHAREHRRFELEPTAIHQPAGHRAPCGGAHDRFAAQPARTAIGAIGASAVTKQTACGAPGWRTAGRSVMLPRWADRFACAVCSLPPSWRWSRWRDAARRAARRWPPAAIPVPPARRWFPTRTAASTSRRPGRPPFGAAGSPRLIPGLPHKREARREPVLGPGGSGSRRARVQANPGSGDVRHGGRRPGSSAFRRPPRARPASPSASVISSRSRIDRRCPPT